MSHEVRAGSSEREAALVAFLEKAGWGSSTRSHLAGDASHRRYERVTHEDGRVGVLMDDPSDPLDTPLSADQRSYGEIAHLAQDCRAFVAIGNALHEEGLSTPDLYAHDLEAGFLLLEDLGDKVFGPTIAGAADPETRAHDLYARAVDVLVHHHQQETRDALPLPDGSTYVLPRYDEEAMMIEVDLILDWYAPMRFDRTLPEAARVSFHEIWQGLFQALPRVQEVLVMRDYHSPNLLDLPERDGVRSIGVIDYQDGLLGHPAYDLMSLLQDARRDIPAALEAELMGRYLTRRPELDGADFRAAYAILGAQRASKIIGIFCRLWKRDGKDVYLPHLPRMWRYLERNLDHPVLASYKAWIDDAFPEDKRERV